MKIIKGNICAPQGFWANGLSCGIKKSGKHDLSLIYSQVPAVSAGVFTKNSIIAAPLVVTKKKMTHPVSQAIVINSGNANCFTGKAGIRHAEKTTEVVAKLLQISAHRVLVTSTGIIGRPLPIDKIIAAAPALVRGLGRNKGLEAAKGILTTDLAVKHLAAEIKLGGKPVRLGAIAKGSGMIAPNMATMLGFVTTDAAISAWLLKKALKAACDASFNRITIDNCMSTNDMVVVLANGLAKNKPIAKPGKDFAKFTEALTAICIDMAKKIVLDAEGATKFITVEVVGAKTDQQAKTAALAIANSNLVKTAAYGSNPNWGRVAAAVGALGLKISEETLKIRFSSFKKKAITIRVDLSLGKKATTVYTSDLSEEYVRINGRYN